MAKFELEQAIRDWKRQFRKNQAFDDAHIEEVEVHLRDAIEELVSTGLDEQAAFNESVSEFGHVEVMAAEEAVNIRPQTSWYPLLFFRNYLKIAIRVFTKQPFITLLNTSGLAIGIAGALLISLYIHHELTYDNMFSDADRIYRIDIDNQTNGEFSAYASAPGPMGAVIQQDCPHVELVTRFREVGDALLKHPDSALNVKENHVIAVDSTFFEMFGITPLEGNAETALLAPYSLVLTTSSAQRLFGFSPAIGQQLMLDNNQVYQVTGIVPDFPKNSFLRNHAVFLSLESFDDAHPTAWNTWYFPTFVKIAPKARVEDLQAFLDTVKESYLIPWAMTFIPGLTIEKSRQQEKETGNFMRFNSIALTDIHLHSQNKEGEFSQNGDMQNIYILSVIGVFLLVMASVNFMNLSTASSLKRAKEVGIRKTLGSSRRGLVRQFLTESGLVALVALVMAVTLLWMVIPVFNEFADKQIAIPWTNSMFWIVLVLFTLVLGFLSGLYPGFVLSAFAPVSMLRSGKGGGSAFLRNGLVVFQFSISIFLIIGTLVVYQQVSFMRSKDLGYQKQRMLVVEDVDAINHQRISFRSQVEKLSGVEAASLSSYLPTPSTRSGTTFFSEGSFQGADFRTEQALIIENWSIDDQYIQTLGLTIIAGRDFSDQPGDSSALIINETTVAMLGLEVNEAIGLRLTNDFRRPDKENMHFMTVIGVVQNFHFESMRNRIDAVSFSRNPDANRMIIRLAGDTYAETIDGVEQLWKSLAPGQPFRYYFMDEAFDQTYQADLQLGRIFLVFTQLSVVIACLGLFGLITFAAEKRSKEVGIRKVLGASVQQITYHLSFEYLKLVGLSIFIAVPIGWVVMNQWLSEFAFRIHVSFETLFLSALLATLIAVVTVSFQSIKAAIVNPVKSLRSE